MSETQYDKLYRKLHPRRCPWSPRGRQMELRDLWPADQEKWKKMIDAASPSKKEEVAET